MIPERLPPDDPAVAARYPGLSDFVEWEEYLDALTLAEAVVQWADESIA